MTHQILIHIRHLLGRNRHPLPDPHFHRKADGSRIILRQHINRHPRKTPILIAHALRKKLCQHFLNASGDQILKGDGSVHATQPAVKLFFPQQDRVLSADFRFKTIFWHRFIWTPERNWLKRAWSAICIGYAFGFGLAISVVKGQFGIAKLKWNSISGAVSFIRSHRYRSLPKVTDNRTY